MEQAQLKIRISNQNDVVMGPGKADLLEAIDHCGSISGAAKHMGMSYKRAWDLADVINTSFKEPLILTSPGGKHGGGAKLTDFGRFILSNYRTLVDKTYSSAELELSNILSNLKPTE
jgi:molybdate transport system regulatory protein